jgi:adenine-specific DNA-methyltransferase
MLPVVGPILRKYLSLEARFLGAASSQDHKKKGQFFTPAKVSSYMAGLLSPPREETFRLLDPGAGVGALSAAVCEHFLASSLPRHLEIDLFENDLEVLPFLREAMAYCAKAYQEVGRSFRYHIHPEDFILCVAPSVFGRPDLFARQRFLSGFDAVLTNPPYFKVNKASQHARIMKEVVHGQPNMYAFFLATAAQVLRPGGELVAITPRSFCNGLYFRSFRRWFLDRMGIDHIHLFGSRTETFKDVLQESVITSWHRLGAPSESVLVTSSNGLDIPSAERRKIPLKRVLDDTNGHAVIRIPTSEEDLAVSRVLDSWPTRFCDLGLRVSTGPVVAFRARDFLLSEPDGFDCAPLLSSTNVRPFLTEWPVKRARSHAAFRVCADSRRLLLPKRNYVLLRRFSAKEESRRLTASCLLRSEIAAPFLALENHLNYICHSRRELTPDEVYGLCALFNSLLFDRYFRTISGNTQVNATEIRSMKFPRLELIAEIGRQVRGLPFPALDRVEQIVLQALGLMNRVGSTALSETLFSKV